MTYKTYGAKKDGNQPTEAMEMSTFFNVLRLQYPDLYKVAIHVRNEGKRTHHQAQKQRAEGGFIKGASDIMIPGAPAFVCEMKSCDKKSRASKDQIAYLENSAALGAFSCLCYGWEAAMEAVKEWRNTTAP